MLTRELAGASTRPIVLSIIVFGESHEGDRRAQGTGRLRHTHLAPALDGLLKYVGIAFLVAAPVAYVAVGWWLDDFAYRIDIGPGVFVLAGVIVLLVTVAPVSYHAIKAALADPVKSLLYE